MSFTANEMVTAISQNETINSRLENRFERAGFAEWLEEGYGADDEDAQETLQDLAHSTQLYEGTEVTGIYRELMDYRESLAPRGLGGWEG